MEFGAGETSKNGFGFDAVQDDTDFSSSYPTPSSIRSSMHWDFSVPIDPYPDSYFPALEDNSSWACEQGWTNLRDDESIPNRVSDHAMISPTLEYEDVSRCPLANSHGISSNCHADLAKITEHEKWNNPLPGTVEHQTGPREHYHASSSTRSPQTSSSVPFRSTSRTRSDPDCSNVLARSDPDCSNVLTRSQALCSPEGQPHPKRRQSWDGYTIPDSGEQLEEKIGVITSKSSSKIAHSVIERRYRENLNTKIAQLDKVLASTCDQKSMTSGEKAVEATAKTRKADVLSDAIKYVRQTELESKDRMQEISFLRSRVAALEKLVIASR